MNNNYKDITIDNLLKVLFNKMPEAFHYRPVTPLHKNLNDLKMEIYLQPYKEWTVSLMASRLNISVGYLEEIYKNTFGVACMDDVIMGRINLAKKYLLYDHYSITEIVTLCGYHNNEHFYRQFKSSQGLLRIAFVITPTS